MRLKVKLNNVIYVNNLITLICVTKYQLNKIIWSIQLRKTSVAKCQLNKTQLSCLQFAIKPNANFRFPFPVSEFTHSIPKTLKLSPIHPTWPPTTENAGHTNHATTNWCTPAACRLPITAVCCWKGQNSNPKIANRNCMVIFLVFLLNGWTWMSWFSWFSWFFSTVN